MTHDTAARKIALLRMYLDRQQRRYGNEFHTSLICAAEIGAYWRQENMSEALDTITKNTSYFSGLD